MCSRSALGCASLALFSPLTEWGALGAQRRGVLGRSKLCAAHRDRFWVARPSSRCPRGRRSPGPSSLGRRAAATPRRTGAARTQKSVVITTNLFSARHRHTYGPRRAGVSRRAAYACGLSACTRPSRARMKSAEKIRDSVRTPHYRKRQQARRSRARHSWGPRQCWRPGILSSSLPSPSRRSRRQVGTAMPATRKREGVRAIGMPSTTFASCNSEKAVHSVIARRRPQASARRVDANEGQYQLQEAFPIHEVVLTELLQLEGTHVHHAGQHLLRAVHLQGVLAARGRRPSTARPR